jgi:hypothetical protein
MIVCLLMVMVQTNSHISPLPSTNNQSSLTITINKQTIISHHYHQQTNNNLSPLPINQSHDYHQQTNNHLSPFVDGDGERIVCLLMLMARDDCLFVGGNDER